MSDDKVRWVVRLKPIQGRTVQDLLKIPLSLDIWQREENALVAVASDAMLREVERRRLAVVERLCTTAEYLEQADRLAVGGPPRR